MDLSTIASLADVALQSPPSPLEPLSRRFVFDAPVTLRIKQNPWTRKVTVRRADTKTKLLQFKHTSSVVGDLFKVKDLASKSVVTVERFGFFEAHYDVHDGDYEQTAKRMPCLYTIDASKTQCAFTFQDLPLSGEPMVYRGVVEGGLRDAVAILTVRMAHDEHAPWVPVARISRSATQPFRMEYETIEVAAGVDVTMVQWWSRFGSLAGPSTSARSHTALWLEVPWSGRSLRARCEASSGVWPHDLPHLECQQDREYKWYCLTSVKIHVLLGGEEHERMAMVRAVNLL